MKQWHHFGKWHKVVGMKIHHNVLQSLLLSLKLISSVLNYFLKLMTLLILDIINISCIFWLKFYFFLFFFSSFFWKKYKNIQKWIKFERIFAQSKRIKLTWLCSFLILMESYSHHLYKKIKLYKCDWVLSIKIGIWDAPIFIYKEDFRFPIIQNTKINNFMVSVFLISERKGLTLAQKG